MQITPINNAANFQAVNQKYYQWAERDFKSGRGVSSEVFEQLRFDVAWRHIHPQDGIDTIDAIKKLIGGTSDGIEHILDGFCRRLKK